MDVSFANNLSNNQLEDNQPHAVPGRLYSPAAIGASSTSMNSGALESFKRFRASFSHLPRSNQTLTSLSYRADHSQVLHSGSSSGLPAVTCKAGIPREEAFSGRHSVATAAACLTLPQGAFSAKDTSSLSLFPPPSLPLDDVFLPDAAPATGGSKLSLETSAADGGRPAEALAFVEQAPGGGWLALLAADSAEGAAAVPVTAPRADHTEEPCQSADAHGRLRRQLAGDSLAQHCEALRSAACHVIRTRSAQSAFYLVDVGEVKRMVELWRSLLPGVTPFYAVKCNPSPALLRVLAEQGTCFDCASAAEIDKVLSLGVPPSRILFANPCKMPSHIRHAAQAGVGWTTFDSQAELLKIRSLHPSCRLLLRLHASDDSARCPLSSKYGALPSEVPSLLLAAAQLGLQVAGVSFHVGSAAADPSAYARAIAAARQVHDTATALGLLRPEGGPGGGLGQCGSPGGVQGPLCGPPRWVLDIGGGFSAAPWEADATDGGAAPRAMSFHAAAAVILDAVRLHFPPELGAVVIGEPGRFFAETSSALVVRVFGRRQRGPLREYWADDGIYGSMNCLLYDGAVLLPPVAIRDEDARTPPALAALPAPSLAPAPLFPSSVFGPTCDSLDTVLRSAPLPELSVGDWLLFPRMGAYTVAASSSFNGFACAAELPVFEWESLLLPPQEQQGLGQAGLLGGMAEAKGDGCDGSSSSGSGSGSVSDAMDEQLGMGGVPSLEGSEGGEGEEASRWLAALEGSGELEWAALGVLTQKREEQGGSARRKGGAGGMLCVGSGSFVMQ